MPSEKFSRKLQQDPRHSDNSDIKPELPVNRSRRKAVTPYSTWSRRKIYKLNHFTQFCPSEGSGYIEAPPSPVPASVKEGNLYIHKVDGKSDYQIWCWCATPTNGLEDPSYDWVRVYQGHERKIDDVTYVLSVNAEGQLNWIMSSTLTKRERREARRDNHREGVRKRNIRRHYSSLSNLPSSSY